MSFFRNLRSSITRGRSSSRDTTPVNNSRPGSVISGGMGRRRDSVESGSDSIFQRSDTFVLDDHAATNDSGLNSNTSTLEKKSKKSKVLEKFSTFTKRKKTPTPDSSAYEHHPSDNATNTYYKWQADGCNSLDYDQHSDPFNFLYDQTSLKSLHSPSNIQPESVRSSNSPNSFDSSTYRKGKMPLELKKQLEQLKHSQHLPEQEDGQGQHQTSANGEEEPKDDLEEADKYKTVTLTSLRKSFRDKFMHQQKETPYNPSWFVQVDTPPPALSPDLPPAKPPRERSVSKENRTDFLVFENDNYRPGSRSPIRDLNTRRPARSATRSPVKRNDTFKVDRRLTANAKANDSNASSSAIRIEFKNSITPNLPGRMVPVGVAKPMPSYNNNNTTDYARRTESPPLMSKSYIIKSSSSTRLNSQPPPLRNWSKPLSQSPTRSVRNSSPMGGGYNAPRSGRFQTLVQIKDNDTNGYGNLQQSTSYAMRPSRHATRIQLGGPSTGLSTGINPPPADSPSFNKRYTNTKVQPLRQTYFGDTSAQNKQYAGPTSARLVQMGTRTQFGQKAMPAAALAFNSKYHHQIPQHHSIATATTTATNSNLVATTQARSTPSYSATGQSHGIGGSGGGGGGFSYLKHQQQPSARILVASQRRSRSPIKIPWR